MNFFNACGRSISRFFGLLLLLAASAASAGYPEKPIRVLVPFAAGGPTDAMARLVSQRMSDVMGQPFVIDNRPGAGGVIATEATATANADGYTLLYATTGVLTINPSLYPNFPLSVERDLAPVGLVGSYINVLVVPAQSSFRNVAELLSAARAKPGTLTFGSAGNGSSNHLSGELLKSMTGTDLVHVPYKGTAPALTDLMAGRLSFMFDASINVAKYVESGKLRALAVTSEKRIAALPGVPTMAESGVKDYLVLGWSGLVAPKGTPRDVVFKLNAALQKVLANTDYRVQMDKMGGGDATPGTPEDFHRVIVDDTAKWSRLVKSNGVKID